jgi:poly(hydroxyalkanoate) granule-associated protein
MARRKTSEARSETDSAAALGESMMGSAQKIWLAGLGAFSRARSEGDSVFNTLVEQGKTLRERARGAADQALGTVRAQADATLGQAQGQWDKLEQVFEDRVSRSLNRLGVLTSREVDDLAKQVRDLNDSVQSLMRSQSGAARKGGKARAAAPRKAKRTAKRTAKKAARKGAR